MMDLLFEAYQLLWWSRSIDAIRRADESEEWNSEVDEFLKRYEEFQEKKEKDFQSKPE